MKHSWTIEYHELETRKRLAVRGDNCHVTAIADIVGNGDVGPKRTISQGDE